MGNQCCDKQHNNNVNNSLIYSTKALMNMNNFNKMDIYFSTQNICRLQGQCLIVFTDNRLKFKKSNLSEKISKDMTRKIKENVQAHLYNTTKYMPNYSNQPNLKNNKNNLKENKKADLQNNNNLPTIEKPQQNNSQTQRQINSKYHLKSQIRDIVDITAKKTLQKQFILIDIDLPTIKFNKLMIIFLEPWQGKKSIKNNVQERISKALKLLVQKNIKFIGIVQFDQQFGIPLNLGAGILARSIFNFSQYFKIATLINRNISDQLSYVSFFQNFKQQLTMSFASKQSQKDSFYF